MNTIFYNRRLMGMAMAPLIVFFLARFLVVIGLPQPSYRASFSRWHMAPHTRIARSRLAPARVSAVAVSVKTPVAVPQALPVMTMLSLKSSLHEYNYHLVGEVTCGGAPCEAELRLSIQTDHNPDLKQVFSTTPDGRFDHQVRVMENAREPIDWRIMVYTPHTYPVEIHGRQILTDDTVLDINRNIDLP